MAVEPSPCPRTLQDLAEREPLETEAAPASKAAARAARPSTDCSMFELDTVFKSGESLYKHGN